jgi:hypothetical protein
MPCMRTTVLSRGCRGIFSFCLLVLAGCGDSDSGGSDSGGSNAGAATISSQPLSGKIGGKAWTFATGQTDAYLSEGEDTYFTELYASTFAACDTWAPDSSAGTIIVLLPRETGRFSLGMSMNVTFYVPPGDNWVATKGSLEITEVTDTTITGGLKASYNSDNTAEGRFTASICP